MRDRQSEAIHADVGDDRRVLRQEPEVGHRMRRRRHVAGWSVAALTLLALESAAAQSPRVTTVGRLLGGLVDTIEVRNRMSGRLGSRGASLRLIRADSAYSGTLTMHAYVPAPRTLVRAGDPQIPARQ